MLFDRIFVGLVAFWLALSPPLALAQSLLGFPPGTFTSRAALDGSGGAAYVGPGDIIAFTWWGGVRAYSAATRGTKALNVCNVADAFCGDLSTDPTTGLLVVGLVGGSNCAVVICTIKTIYDKVGTNDATQSTIANRPVLTQNALNTAWGMTSSSSGASTKIFTSTGYTASQPYSFVVIANATNATGNNIVISIDNTFVGAGLFANSTTLTPFAGTTYSVTATAAFHASQTVLNGASSLINVDGIETPGNTGTDSLINTDLLGLPGELGGNNAIDGVIMEGGFVAGTISPTNRTAINANLHAAYGGWL